MASHARNTVAAINAAAADPRYPAPAQRRWPSQRRWKGYWSRLWCFGSQKRGKRIVPASRGDGATGSSRGWTAAGSAQPSFALAPPSSPASFVNSSVQSPASFTLSLSAASASMCSPGPANTMFTIGPYAHETQLVSPPVFSTFTTEPSTAPLTPPPELAHLTTPSSPDVPFAQLLASSLEAKTTVRENLSPFCGSPLASPGHLQSAYHLYLGSPVGHLISPTSGILGSGTSSPVPDIEFPAQLRGAAVSSFPTFEPFASLTFDRAPCVTLILPQSSELESQKTVMSPEANGMNCRTGIDLDLRSNTYIQGGTSRNVPFNNTDTCHLGSTVIHQNDILLRVGEEQDKPLRAELLKGVSFYGPARNNQQFFHADADDKDSKSPSKDASYTNVAKAALAKREDLGTEQWMGRSDLVVGHKQKSIIEGLSHLTVRGCLDLQATETISQPPQINKEDSIEECHRTGSGEVTDNLGKGLQESHQHNAEIELGNGAKHCVHNCEAFGCRRCGDVTVKCSELSAALELAKERLANYDNKGKADDSPDRNETHVPQWMHIGVSR